MAKAGILWHAPQVLKLSEFDVLMSLMNELDGFPDGVLERLAVHEQGEFASVDGEADFGIVQKYAGKAGEDGAIKDGKCFAHVRQDFVARMEQAGVLERVKKRDPLLANRLRQIFAEFEAIYDAVSARVLQDLRIVDVGIRLGANGYKSLDVHGHSLARLFEDHRMFSTLRVLRYNRIRPGTDVLAGKHWDRAGLTYHLRDTNGGLYIDGEEYKAPLRRVIPAHARPYVVERDEQVPVWSGHQAEVLFEGGCGEALLHEVRGVAVPRFAAIFFVNLMTNRAYAPHYRARRDLERLMREASRVAK